MTDGLRCSPSLIASPRPRSRAASGPADRRLWWQIVDRDPFALPSQTPRWMDALERSGRFTNASRWYRFEDGVQAVLPLVARRGPGVILGLSSLPNGWGVGGAVSTEPLTASHVDVIVRDLWRVPALRVAVWPSAMQGGAWRAARRHGAHVQERRAHVVPLCGDFEHTFRRQFNKTTRRYYRRAIENGVTIEESCNGRLVAELHDMIMRAVPRWARQQNEPVWLARTRARLREPLSKFRHICEAMGSDCRIAVARCANADPIGASLFLLGHNAEEMWAPLDPDRGIAMQAGTALAVHTIKTACDHGCGYVDLGESGRSWGLHEAKRRVGGVAIDYLSVQIERVPLAPAETWAKRLVKQLIGFRDAESDIADSH